MIVQRLACGVALLALGAGGATAQLVNGRLTTSFYTFERFDTVGTSRTYARAFQAIQLSAAQGDISLNTYFLGAMNGTNEFGDNGRVRFYNLYLRWANIANMGEFSLGRQAVYAGAGNGSIDGLAARVRLLENSVTVQGYGGSVVKEEFTGVRSNWHDNLSYGGQIVTTALPDARCAVSYMHRKEETDPYWTLRSRDTTFTPLPYYITPLPSEEEVGSVDVSYAYGNTATVYGRYDYDFLAKNTMRGQGAVRVNATPALAVTGEFIYRKPHVSFNSIFAAFTQNSVTEVEGGLEYQWTPLFRVFGKLGSVSYTDDNSLRWSGGIFCNYATISYAGGKGYAGKFQSFNIQGSYPLFDRMVVPTAGVSWVSYKLSMETPRQEALAILAGATVRPVKQFSFDVQGQWMRNKLYNSDMRLQVRLMYWFAERLSLFSGEVKP
jgi:hypothetical protein